MAEERTSLYLSLFTEEYIPFTKGKRKRQDLEIKLNKKYAEPKYRKLKLYIINME